MVFFYLFAFSILPILGLISFFFSMTETALIGLSKIRLKHLVAREARGARRLERLILRLDRVITAILVGNNLVNIAISAIITAWFVMHFGPHWGAALATFVSTCLILVFCEITPKLVATKHAEKVALLTAPFMEVFLVLLRPATVLFGALSNAILKALGIGPGRRSPLLTEEELRLMIEVGREEGVLTEEERKMMHRIFEFGDLKVAEVMVPRTRIVAVEAATPVETLLATVIEQGHDRIPVYRGSLDTVIGVLHTRDLLYMVENRSLFVLADLVRPVHFVARTMRVSELLKVFQTDKVQIAVVIDEGSRPIGLVTLEDLIEEIVGEIEETHPQRNVAKN